MHPASSRIGQKFSSDSEEKGRRHCRPPWGSLRYEKRTHVPTSLMLFLFLYARHLRGRNTKTRPAIRAIAMRVCECRHAVDIHRCTVFDIVDIVYRQFLNPVFIRVEMYIRSPKKIVSMHIVDIVDKAPFSLKKWCFNLSILYGACKYGVWS